MTELKRVWRFSVSRAGERQAEKIRDNCKKNFTIKNYCDILYEAETFKTVQRCRQGAQLKMTGVYVGICSGLL